jgi:helix-turn-helix protein
MITGPPFSAKSQRERILPVLREAARRSEGVSSTTLLYTLHIRQFPTRIFELKAEGFVIESHQHSETRLVTYFLKSEPLERKAGGDWFTGRGQQRPTGLPLFDTAVSH